jgi:hypothetical protein
MRPCGARERGARPVSTSSGRAGGRCPPGAPSWAAAASAARRRAAARPAAGRTSAPAGGWPHPPTRARTHLQPLGDHVHGALPLVAAVLEWQRLCGLGGAGPGRPAGAGRDREGVGLGGPKVDVLAGRGRLVEAALLQLLGEHALDRVVRCGWARAVGWSGGARRARACIGIGKAWVGRSARQLRASRGLWMHPDVNGAGQAPRAPAPAALAAATAPLALLIASRPRDRRVSRQGGPAEREAVRGPREPRPRGPAARRVEVLLRHAVRHRAALARGAPRVFLVSRVVADPPRGVGEGAGTGALSGGECGAGRFGCDAPRAGSSPRALGFGRGAPK